MRRGIGPRRGGRQGYDAKQVCLNGHHITDSYHDKPHLRQEYCNECGEETIHECSECGTEIRGKNRDSTVLMLQPRTIPEHCRGCGEAFPWMEGSDEGDVEKQPQGPETISARKWLEQVFDRFHAVANQLRHRYDGRSTLDVKDEYDVQDLLRALLFLFFDDVRPEETTPSYAGKSARMDFILKEHSIAIEVKMTGPDHADSAIGDELIEDISRYEGHPDCDTLVCFIYDPDGRMQNPAGLEKDLNQDTEDLSVEIFVRPSLV